MELVFATHNANKVNEIRQVLPPHISIKTLEDIGCREEIAENSDTLEGNALIKASYVLKKYGYLCFADDTGLEVDILEGAPGVFSARYAGMPKNETRNVEKLLYDMEGKTNRNARFTTVIALCLQNQTHIFRGEVKGVITREPIGSMGFGYDPVFQPIGWDKTFAQVSLAEKNRISHRARAIAALVEFLENRFQKD